MRAARSIRFAGRPQKFLSLQTGTIDPTQKSQGAICAALRAPGKSFGDYLTEQMARIDWPGLQSILPSLLADAASDDKRTAAAITSALEAESPQEKWVLIEPMIFTQKGTLRGRTYNASSAKDPAVTELLAVKGDLGSLIHIALETQDDTQSDCRG